MGVCIAILNPNRSYTTLIRTDQGQTRARDDVTGIEDRKFIIVCCELGYGSPAKSVNGGRVWQ